MLKELPKEFKDLLKNFYYQEGFIGFLDGLLLKDGLPYGRGIAVFNSIPNAIKENLSDLMFYFGTTKKNMIFQKIHKIYQLLE